MNVLSHGEQKIYHYQELQIDDYLIKNFGYNLGSYMDKQGYRPFYKIRNRMGFSVAYIG